MLAGLNECGLFICESVWLPDCSPISCFYNIFALLCTNIVLPWVVYCFLYGVLPPSLWDIFWMLFNMCVLNVIAIAVDRPVCICLWVVFDMFQDSIQWISLSVCMFCCLVMYVSICCYWCQLDMLSVVCDPPASCCELYCVWTVMMIVVSFPNNCPMGLWSTVFLLNCYSWPYGLEMQRLVKHHCYFYAACLLTCYGAHHHYLHLLVFYLRQAWYLMYQLVKQ